MMLKLFEYGYKNNIYNYPLTQIVKLRYFYRYLKWPFIITIIYLIFNSISFFRYIPKVGSILIISAFYIVLFFRLNIVKWLSKDKLLTLGVAWSSVFIIISFVFDHGPTIGLINYRFFRSLTFLFMGAVLLNS